MDETPGFEVVPIDGGRPHETLVAGIASRDLAGLTAVDYLVDTYESTPVAAARTRGLPDIATITDGLPRHPVRIHRVEELDVSILVSEVFVPVALADRFADALADWMEASGITSVTLLHGGQFPHAEAEHVPFLVATDGYRERFGAAPLEPLPAGMLDGLAGELLVRGLEGAFPPGGVIVTPAHVPGPDVSAALTLLEGLAQAHGLAIDDSELRERSEQFRQYYEGIAERMRALQEAEGSATTRDFPEDRMYM